MPVGGLDSAKFLEALRSRPCSEELLDCPRLRLGSVVSLGRRGVIGDSVNDGKGSGAVSFTMGVAFLLELLVAGGVEGSMTCCEL